MLETIFIWIDCIINPEEMTRTSWIYRWKVAVEIKRFRDSAK